MNTVQPIRDWDKIQYILEYLRKTNERNYILFLMGISTGLRIQDILKLRVRDLKGRTHIIMRENKTKKEKRMLILPSLKKELEWYLADKDEDDFLIKSRVGMNRPITRGMAYKILQKIAKEFQLKELGCHSMRKSFGYHFYQRTKDVALLQKIFNHNDQNVTLLYIGVSQDHMDNTLRKFDYMMQQRQ